MKVFCVFGLTKYNETVFVNMFKTKELAEEYKFKLEQEDMYYKFLWVNPLTPLEALP